MRAILVYATKPELKPLAFVSDPSDAANLISSKLELAQELLRGRQEKADAVGGSTPTLGLDRWRSAKCIEVDLEVD